MQLNLGDVAGGQEVSFGILIDPSDPDGAGETVASYTSSCGCTVLDFEPDILQSGHPRLYRGRIRFSSTGEKMEYAAQTVTLNTDRRIISVSITARILPFEGADLSRVEFRLDDMSPDQTVEREIPAGFVISKIEFERDWTNRGLEVVHAAGGSSNILIVRMHRDLMRGYIHKEIKKVPWLQTITANVLLKDSSSTSRLLYKRLPVEIVYTGPVRSRPGRLDFGVLREDEEAARDVMITGPAALLADISVQTPGFIRSVLGELQGDTRTLHLVKACEPKISDNAVRHPPQPAFSENIIEIRYPGGMSYQIPLYYILQGRKDQNHEKNK